MEAVLLVMLLGVCYGVETYCDGRQDGARCYGVLGGTAVLQLMSNISEIPQYEWKRKMLVILKGRKNNITHNTIKNRSLFIPTDGTFKINNLSRNDSNEYTLEVFDSNGHKTGNQTLWFSVQAPVSSVQLVFERLFQGEMKVSCTSEGGDSPQYSWTLDGHTLTDSQLLSGNNETNIITLKQNVSGRLACSVGNHISSGSKDRMILAWGGMETYCDGRQDGALCYGGLGGTVIIQLMDNAPEIPRYELKKETLKILSGRNKKIILNSINSRSVFIPSDGTFSINNLSKNDSGEYTLEIFDSNGQNTGKVILKLLIQAPVSSVQLVSQCHSQGHIWVSCSSEGGDSPQYGWTLDGHTLTDTELLSGNNETNFITLKHNISGRLVCSVRNHISSVSKQKMISACRDPSLFICGLLAFVAVISFVGIGVFFKWKQIKSRKTEESTETHRAENSEDLAVIEMRTLSNQ